MPHHRCCYVGRWGKGDLKDSVRDSAQTCKCQTHWARRSGKHKPLGTTVRHHLGKVSVIQIISELLSAITETIPGLSRRIICY